MQRRKTETAQSKLIHEKQQLTSPILFFKFLFAATYTLRSTVVQLYVNLHSIVLIQVHLHYRPIVIVLHTC
jgi:hypothetical protein